MAIVFVNDGTSAAPDVLEGVEAGKSVTTASWTPPSSGLIIVGVVGSDGGGGGGVISNGVITGNGITWVRILDGYTSAGATCYIALFGADASGSTTGTTTISVDYAAANVALGGSFFHATGTDVAHGVAQTFVQSGSIVGTSSGATVTLPNGASHADNRSIFVCGNSANRQPVTPRASWTEMDELTAGSKYVLETQYRSDAFEQTGSATWSFTGAKGGIAAEIKAAVASTGFVAVTIAGL